MKKLDKEEIKILVHKIRMGEGSDEEVSEWIKTISFSTYNPEVIRTIMGGINVSDEEIVERLFDYKPIIFVLGANPVSIK